MIDRTIIEAGNAARTADLTADYDALGARLARRGVDIEALTTRAMGFGVAVPSWGTGTGGTRFARFPGAGEPAGIMDKLEDCGVIHALTAATPRVSLHIPWDKADPALLVEKAEEVGLGFDAMNSNTARCPTPTPRPAGRPSSITWNVSRSAGPSGRAR
ncbi:hypothetical protein [Paracoccus shandongensis]|uniref:hypothetical protein n=1 Tax=Paracoccus shandongensis TaxID=2816048 RepID=UPI001F1B58A2|nr:hypothetical protein [Paracoccus shandongensis]